MKFFLWSPMFFDPWFVVLPFYTGVYSLIFSACSIVLTMSWRKKRSLSAGAEAMPAALLVCSCVFFFIFLFCLLFPHLFPAFVAEEAAMWSRYNSKVGFTAILLNTLGFLLTLSLLVRLRRLYSKSSVSSSLKERLGIPIAFIASIICLPVISSYYIGSSWERTVHLLYASFLIGTALITLSKMVHGPRLRTLLGWLSMAGFLTWFTFMFVQPLIVRLELPAAFSYSYKLIERLEPEKNADGIYPLPQNVSKLMPRKPPHLIRQTYQIYNLGDKGKKFILTIDAGSHLSFQYDSKSKKWTALMFNGWY